MDPITLAVLGLSGLGGLFGNRPEQTQQSQNFQNWSDTFNTPYLDDWQKTVRELMLNQYANLSTDRDLSGYEASQQSNINKLSDVKARAIQENFGARGVTGPAVATALNTNNADRISDISQLKASMPLLKEQVLTNRLGAGVNFFNALPTTIRSSTGSYGDSSGTGNQSGNMLGGLFGGMGSTLAYLLGQGAIGRKKS